MDRSRGTSLRMALLLSSLAALSSAASAEAAEGLLARGDGAYARRAEGQRDGRAAAGPIDEAIGAYEAAFREDPKHLEAGWKLSRAIFFRAEYATPDAAERERILARGVEYGRLAERELAAALGATPSLEDAEPAVAAQAFRGNPHAAPTIFWGALLVASAARDANAIEALRSGIASRLRRYAELVIALDPGYEAGGAHRLLGRLHAELPRIPFLTAWVERERAVGELRRALALGPEDPVNQLLLARTLLELAPDERSQALALLERVASAPPRPDSVVEDAGAVRLARDLLARAAAP